MVPASYPSWLGLAFVCLIGAIVLMKYVTTAKWGNSYRAYLVYSIAGLGLASFVIAVFGALAIVERDWFIVVLLFICTASSLWGVVLSWLMLRGRDVSRWQLLPRLKKLFVDD